MPALHALQADHKDAPPAFHLLAKPTGAVCNLDCSYCFFLSKEMLYPGSRFRMADDLLETYLRQLIEAHASVAEVLDGMHWLADRQRTGRPARMETDWSSRRHSDERASARASRATAAFLEVHFYGASEA